MNKALTLAVLLTLTPLVPSVGGLHAHAWTWSNNPVPNQGYSNPYNSPQVYDSNGQFRGNLNGNAYDPNSIANPYGRYGSKFSPDSLTNPYAPGRWGNPITVVPSR